MNLIEDGVAELDGKTYITAARADAYVGVNAALVRDWKRRGLVTATKWQGLNWYPLTKLENVEAATCGRTKPRTATRG
jgi:hypothetical protein